jgi:hypothetical protein
MINTSPEFRGASDLCHGQNHAFWIRDRLRLETTVDLTSPSPVIVPVPPPQQRRNRLPMSGGFIAFPGED